MSSSSAPASAGRSTKRRAASVQSARKAANPSPFFEEVATEVGAKSVKSTRHQRRVSEPEFFYSPSSRMSEQKLESEEEEEVIPEEQMTVAQLQAELRKFGAKVTGKKQDLIERLRELKVTGSSSVEVPKTPKYVEILVPKTTSRKKKRVPEEDVVEEKENETPIQVRPPFISKATDLTKPGAPATTTSTASTSSGSNVPATPAGNNKQLTGAGEKPQPGAEPSAPPPIGGVPLPPQTPAPAPAPPSGITVMASPVGGPAPMDTRFLRVQYPGKPADTIRFDINDKMVVENVSAMLRNLFPDQKVNLDPKLDIEPVYLMDEYGELHVVTLDFLRNCPGVNDPPSGVYQARKGPIVITIEDAQLKRYTFNLAVAATAVQVILVLMVFGPRFLFGNLPQFGSFGLMNALHDWAGFGYPASFLFTLAHAATWFIACSYLSPAFRFGIKLWYPRLMALGVDMRKGWARTKFAFQRRRQALVFRLSGYGRPLPARLGLGVRANWIWLVTKRWLTSDLTSRVRRWLPEAVIVSFVALQMGLSVNWSTVLLVMSFARPRRQTMLLFWQGEMNAEVVLWEMMVTSLALPGFETNLKTVALDGPPTGVQRLGANDNSIRIRWGPPADIPRVSTTSDKTYSVGVSRYVIEAADVNNRVMTYECAAPGRDWARMITLEEVVYLITVVAQTAYIHPVLASLLGVGVLYSCLTAPDATFKGAAMVLDGLLPDIEYAVTVRAVDDLNRRGLASQPLISRTRPKTLFRRLLLASEEVPRKAPPAPPAPAPVPPVATSTSTTTIHTTAPPGSTVESSEPGATVKSASGEIAEVETKVMTQTSITLPPPAVPAGNGAPSKTEGHIRYAGVVWNLAMDEKETELFLRTMRSAMLPDPRKEKFEADLIFSTESKSMHQVISPSYLRTLASMTFNPFTQLWAWYSDPLLIAHPAGTRHTFAPETIYNHMVLPKNRVDWGLTLFIAGTIASYMYAYFQAQATGQTDRFWQQTYLDLLRTGVQMFVLSNIMIIALKRAKALYEGNAANVQQRITSAVRGRINDALNAVVGPDQVLLRGGIVAVTALFLCVLALLVNGTASFTGIVTCLLVLNLARTAADDAMLGQVRDEIRARTRGLVAPVFNLLPGGAFMQAVLVTAVAGFTAGVFWSVVGGLTGVLGGAGLFALIRMAFMP